MSTVAWHGLDRERLIERLGVDPAQGLTREQVAARQQEHGPNRLRARARRPAWRRLLDQFASPLILVLIGAAVLAGFVGELRDAVVIAVVLTLNAVLGFVQEGRAADALRALEGMLEPETTVRRDGRAVDVAVEGLVPGDVVLLEAGDRVPADGRLVHASSLAADESMLTGESVPVDKDAAPVAADDPGLSERRGELFMNTTVVRGRAELVVTGIGMGTEVGRIAELLDTGVETDTPLERQLDVLGKRLIWIVLAAVLVVLGLSLARGVPVEQALLEAVALGVAAIPEGLPAVVTVTLAVGVSLMAQQRAIVRRLASVETLGSTSAICTDKTGTLTRNEMTPVEVWHAGSLHAVDDLGAATGDGQAPAGLPAALAVGVHASDASLDVDGEEHVGDPTEVAVLLAARAAGVDVASVARTPREGELPFDSTRKLMATVVEDGGRRRVMVKGAPDVLLDRCDEVVGADGREPLDDARRAELDGVLAQASGRGHRVLALATVPAGERTLDEPEEIAEHVSGGLVLQALVAMIDPPRDGVAAAIERCPRAGVRVRMVTGDHPGTAAAIAAQVGIAGEAVTGRELEAMDDAELAARIGDIGVCARVSPEHKVRIVDALHAHSEVVAMTGDGVNDAAALRRADVGVAMGIAGTEVTKEAADIVLADDDFTTIVTAVERGRTIYDNIVRFVRFQLTTNLAALSTILVAGVAGLASPFTALQILFVNLIADGPPAMALGVDQPREEVMDRPPRDPHTGILSREVVWPMAITAAVMAAATLAVSALAGDEARLTMTFTTFVLLQLANVLAVRAGRGPVLARHQLTNRWVWLALAAVLVVQVAIVHLGPLQSVFDTVALSAGQWATAVAVGLLPAALAEARGRLAGR